MKDKTESIKQALLTVLALAVMVVIFGVFLMTQGVNPIQIYGDMIVSTLGNSYGIGQVVVKSSPFIMVAVATAISAKAGLVNVGGEGQLANRCSACNVCGGSLLLIHAGSGWNPSDACGRSAWWSGMERTCRTDEGQSGNE